jgi:hypothetical protein
MAAAEGLVASVTLGAIAELRDRPMSFVLLSACILANFYLFVSFNGIERQIGGIQQTLRLDHLDTRLHNVDGELFSLTQKVNSETAASKPIDDLYYKRINELKDEKQQLYDELSIMRRENNGT